MVRCRHRYTLAALAVAALGALGAIIGSSVAIAADARTQASQTAQTARGLLITPVREFIKLDAGSHKTGSLTVANLTDSPAKVTLSVKQFSVADYTYDYQFADPTNDWIKLELTEVDLKPGASRTIGYAITVPKGSAIGGQYYTLFASTQLTNSSGSGLQGTVKAASLLYLTVGGHLVQTSRLQGSTLPHLSFGNGLNYSLDILNTGNVHYIAYVSAGLRGGFGIGGHRHEDSSHLLLPGKPLIVPGHLAAPRLPGVYKLTAGYKTDADPTRHEVSSYVVFIPPWSLAALLALLLGWLMFHRRSRR